MVYTKEKDKYVGKFLRGKNIVFQFVEQRVEYT